MAVSLQGVLTPILAVTNQHHTIKTATAFSCVWNVHYFPIYGLFGRIVKDLSGYIIFHKHYR